MKILPSFNPEIKFCCIELMKQICKTDKSVIRIDAFNGFDIYLEPYDEKIRYCPFCGTTLAIEGRE